MNNYIQKLVRFNNRNQQPIIPEAQRRHDWRYQIMELSPIDLEIELSNWSREKMINWLDWNDPNGIWTDEDAIAEDKKPLSRPEAARYIFKLLNE